MDKPQNGAFPVLFSLLLLSVFVKDRRLINISAFNLIAKWMKLFSYFQSQSMFDSDSSQRSLRFFLKYVSCERAPQCCLYIDEYSKNEIKCTWSQRFFFKCLWYETDSLIWCTHKKMHRKYFPLFATFSIWKAKNDIDTSHFKPTRFPFAAFTTIKNAEKIYSKGSSFPECFRTFVFVFIRK